MDYYNIHIPQTVQFFKEEAFSRTLSLPSKKPDIDRIIRSVIYPEVEDYKLIQTDAGFSYEGQRLTKNMLVVTVKLNIKIIFTTNSSDESIFSSDFVSYKAQNVVLPDQDDGIDIKQKIKLNQMQVMSYIGAQYEIKIDDRTIEQSGLLLVDVTFS